MATQTTILQITGMSCGSCVGHVDTTLRLVPGVSAVRVDQRARTAHITHEAETTSEELIAATVDAGYHASLAS